MKDQLFLLKNTMNQVIRGKESIIRKVFAAVFAGGHILLEDVPGVGKTTLAVAVSKVLGLDYKRVQFTPDVLPADITGFSMYNAKTDSFEYRPGAAMTNLLLADEINRTSPKTQSALLEIMEEGSITVDGVTHYRGWRHASCPVPIHCHCNRKSDRLFRHTASSGITAGSLHDLHLSRLSFPSGCHYHS
ncbi:aTPase [Roseburia sp. CAG:303]|nr:aTPase [Roseburia sp. CAG:303]